MPKEFTILINQALHKEPKLIFWSNLEPVDMLLLLGRASPAFSWNPTTLNKHQHAQKQTSRKHLEAGHSLQSRPTCIFSSIHNQINVLILNSSNPNITTSSTSLQIPDPNPFNNLHKIQLSGSLQNSATIISSHTSRHQLSLIHPIFNNNSTEKQNMQPQPANQQPYTITRKEYIQTRIIGCNY